MSLEPFEGLYHNDLAPVGFLSVSASQLLGAVEAAWVFGGMGSWNDAYFHETEKTNYDRLSKKLNQLLNRGIAAAAKPS